MSSLLRIIILTIVALSKPTLFAQGVIGTVFVHDPVLIKQEGVYHIFYTGPRVMHIQSTTRYGTNWGKPTSVFATLPSWTSQLEGFTGDDLWAPDISYRNNKYWLYYSASSFGSRNSGIGLATNPTLNADSSNYKWTDQGLVIRTYQSGSKYNAIDPNSFLDTDGKLWLVFGSWQPEGIQLVRLDPGTGKFFTGAVPQTVAKRSNQAVEAPFIVKWNGYYYLFVSWDACCKGESSTYKIVVGRSESVEGPYLDKNNTDMNNGGGVVLDQSNDTWKGPGHNGIFIDNDTMFCINHAYNAVGGAATLFIRPLYWENNWPQFSYVPPTSAGSAPVKRLATGAHPPQLLLDRGKRNLRVVAITGNERYTLTGISIKNR